MWCIFAFHSLQLLISMSVQHPFIIDRFNGVYSINHKNIVCNKLKRVI